MSERGDVADWLGTGLQSPLIGFDSRRRLNCLLGYIANWYEMRYDQRCVVETTYGNTFRRRVLSNCP